MKMRAVKCESRLSTKRFLLPRQTNNLFDIFNDTIRLIELTTLLNHLRSD